MPIAGNWELKWGQFRPGDLIEGENTWRPAVRGREGGLGRIEAFIVWEELTFLLVGRAVQVDLVASKICLEGCALA